MSELQKLETDLVSVAKKFQAGIEEAGNDAVKVADWLQKNSSTITSLAALAGPSAVSVSAVGLQLVNLAVTAVKQADSASLANGVNVTLDQNAIAEVKALIQAIEKI